jgi:hypothetical protein
MASQITSALIIIIIIIIIIIGNPQRRTGEGGVRVGQNP